MILADKIIENSYIERKNTKSTYEDRNAMSNQDTTVLINQAEDGHTKVDVRFEDETVWLSQQHIW